MNLQEFIESSLGSLKDYVGWTDADTEFVVLISLENYGVATEALATDAKKIHSIAKTLAFEKVLSELALNYNFSSDGGTFNRNQVYESVKKMYDSAVTDSMMYMPVYNIRMGEFTTEQDPYGLDSVSRLELGI